MTTNTKYFLGILFSLAAVGLFVKLNTNPLTFFFSIALAVGLVFFINRMATNRFQQDSGYQKALRSQKKKGKLRNSELHKLTKLKKSKGEVPFRVIKGNKKGKSTKDKETNTNYH